MTLFLYWKDITWSCLSFPQLPHLCQIHYSTAYRRQTTTLEMPPNVFLSSQKRAKVAGSRDFIMDAAGRAYDAPKALDQLICLQAGQRSTPMKSYSVSFCRVLFVAPPEVLVSKQSRKLSVGANTTLTCRTRGSPQPTISWSRRGGQLPRSD